MTISEAPSRTATLTLLNQRRITRQGYFRNLRATMEQLYRSKPLFGDPYAFTYGVQKGAPAEAEYLRKVAIMLANQYPGDIFGVDPTPPFGRYHQSALVQRVKLDQGAEILKLSPENGVNVFPETLVRETERRILNGEVMWEHMVGGKATRLGINEEKFVLTPQDLIERYKVFYAQKTEESKRTGKAIKLERPDSLPAAESLGYENSEMFGVRHMLAFAYNIKQLADKHGVSWQDALSKQTVFIVANEKILPRLLELFKSFGFFGLDREKVYFMASQNYNALVLTDEGKFVEQTAEDFIHNHGAARSETTEAGKWSTVDSNGKLKKHTAGEIENIYAGHANLQSLNIEDLDYLIKAVDPHTQALALNTKTMIGEEYHMMMDVVGQKDPPQKGGVLVLDENFFGDDEGRLVMVESFQAYPRFHHYIEEVARQLWREIKWLNLNMNNYPNPRELFRMVRDGGLPVWMEMKNGGFRNESPQGDANYFLPTLFVARTEIVGSEAQPIPIACLKEAADIPNGLKFLAAQTALQGFGQLVGDFAYRGLTAVDYSFAQLSSLLKDAPIDVRAVLAHPYLSERLPESQAKTLRALQEVFQVEGSHVYSARLEKDSVIIRLIADSRRGTAVTYPSAAIDNEIEASPKMSRIFRDARIWTGRKKNYSYVAIANQKDGQGEVLFILGKYNEEVPAEKKSVFLSAKLSRVMEYIEQVYEDEDVPPKDLKARITAEFLRMTWQYLFENNSSTIAHAIHAKLK